MQIPTRLKGKLSKKRIFWVLLFLIIVLLISIFVIPRPSNNRNWEFGFGTLPEFTFQDNLITIKNMRDYKYDFGKTLGANYITRTIDPNTLEKVWFVMEPFDIKALPGFKGGGHTYLVFDFQNQEPVVLSVEARREKGEEYNAISGIFNKYELMYVWASERDVTGRRVVVENNKLFMYPLTMSKETAQKLFKQLAATSHKLETQPRFYNSIFSNCTNELAKNMNKVKVGSVPFTFAFFAPAYSVNRLYQLGYIPNNMPLADENKKYFISDYVRQYFNDPNFSQLLRQKLI